MLLSLAVILIVALAASVLFEKCRLPGLLGMVLTGVVLGPEYGGLINLDKSVAGGLRNIALLIILIRAGLGLNRTVLNKIGRDAVRMSFIPGLIEAAVVWAVAHLIFGMPGYSAGMLAFILAAVSPAVIVPQMLDLKESGYGKKKEVPTLVLAGASVDDVVAITLFGAMLSLGLAQSDSTMVPVGLGQSGSLLLSIAKIPVSIVVGILVGLLLGLVLIKFFKRFHMRDTRKVIVFLVVAMALMELEHAGVVPIASLLGVMSIGFVILEKYDVLAKRLASKFNKVWVLAEIVLFVLIGSAFDPADALSAGTLGVAVIAAGLCGRSVGVMISLKGSVLNAKEKLFCVLAYLPKATVQAAIGAIPLSQNVAEGKQILAVAILSIIITAPLGAIAINIGAKRLLEVDERQID